MPKEDFIEPIDAENLKLNLCLDNCNYVFQPTETETTKDEKNNRERNKVLKGCLFCTICTHSLDLDFD